jgi:hypothetical protein
MRIAFKKITITILTTTFLFGIFSPFVAKAQDIPTMAEICGQSFPVGSTGYNSCMQAGQNAQDKTIKDAAKGAAAIAIATTNAALGPVATLIGYIITTISSVVLIFAGFIYDEVIKFTIIDMSANIGTSSAKGLGESISGAWTVLRDIANMAFIFVLLYAAFRAMFDSKFSNFGTIVKNIIIVALLINFSLFFTKVAIDASNIASIGFYRAISQSGTTLTGTGIIGSAKFDGISGGYMKMLGLQSLFDSNILGHILNAEKALTIGFMSSAFMLIAAVIFLVTGVMFAARFIILIFLMILSPLAAVAYAIPGQQGHFWKWVESLKSQLLFPPIFFALTWVTFRLGNTLLTKTLTTSSFSNPSWATAIMDPFANVAETAALLLNFVLVIGFSIAALIFSKQVASQTMGFNTVAGGIGTIAAGGAAWAGRQTIGRTGANLAGNASLQEAAATKKGFSGAASRLTLYAAKKAQDAKFDARNATIPTSAAGDLIRGTAGRTGWGKKLGLNDVNIQNVSMGSLGVDTGILGKGATKGYKETKAESDKRIREREATEKSELNLAQSKKAILAGSQSGITPGTPTYDAMESALSKLSDKETETLVASNRDLLKSLNFANAISVKQLEALNKSDQFSEAEKGDLRGMRFKDIESIGDAAGIAALAVPVAARTPTQAAAAAKVEKARKKTSKLSDSELEMISPNYFDPSKPEGREFIGQLKSKQLESIGKSSKFTTTQKDNINTERVRPLLDALRSGATTISQPMVKKADIKTKVGYMKPTGTPPIQIATHPDILPIYTPKILRRMANHDDMSDQDVSDLRLALLGPAGTGVPGVQPGTVAWLNDPNKGGEEFPA